MDTKTRLMFLYLRTGGGHLAPAKSVANYIEKNYGDSFETELIDGFEKTNPAVKSIIVDGYRLLQSRAKMYYQYLYALNKISLFSQQNIVLISHFSRPYLEERILESRPSKIFIFHFFLIDPVIKILKKHNLNTEIFIAVTDPFTAHPVWFIKKKYQFLLFSEKLREYAAGKNIPRKNIHVFPFILDERYSYTIDQNAIPGLKKKYGLSADKKMLLIIGGGDGIPKGTRILRRLIADNSGYEIVIVAGKNKSLFKSAEKIRKELAPGNLIVFGFVDFVYELINMSDAVITKCGASTIMEIVLQKKIPIVIDYLWEQEKGNVEFIVDGGMGIFEKNTEKLPAIVNRLFSDSVYYNSFIENIESHKLKNGTASVADFICNSRPA